jgi:ArsR family transcriptional regulator
LAHLHVDNIKTINLYFEINTDQLAVMFKAISNPHRLALFYRLTNCCAPGTCCSADEASRMCVGELGEGLKIAPSTLSHHLKELHRAGLVSMERRGKNVMYWVEPNTLTTLSRFFAAPLQEKPHE